MKRSTRPLVAVDSDTLLFRAAAVCDGRSIEVLHEPTGITKGFKNKTEFKELMKSKDKVITDDYKIKELQNPEPVQNALKIIKYGAEEILDNFLHCDVIFCAGAENNFRDSLPYPTKYKGNRTSMLKPVLLKECQEYFRKRFNSVKAYGQEIDDLVAVLAYEALAQGREAFILSPDGDSRQFDGIMLGSYSSKPEECELLESFPAVSWNAEKKQVHSAGFPWMIMQASVGDASDGLNPSHLCEVKYGEKRWYNAVKNFTNPKQYIDYIQGLYQKWYPEEFEYTSWDCTSTKADWKFMLNLYWKGTTMKRSRDKIPDFWEFIQEKGYV